MSGARWREASSSSTKRRIPTREQMKMFPHPLPPKQPDGDLRRAPVRWIFRVGRGDIRPVSPERRRWTRLKAVDWLTAAIRFTDTTLSPPRGREVRPPDRGPDCPKPYEGEGSLEPDLAPQCPIHPADLAYPWPPVVHQAVRFSRKAAPRPCKIKSFRCTESRAILIDPSGGTSIERIALVLGIDLAAIAGEAVQTPDLR